MKIKTWIAALMVITLLVGAGIIIFSGKSETATEDQSNINYDKLDEVVFDVVTKPVIKGNLLLYINANGIARASEELEITSNISGIINNLNINEGKNVNKGELLIALDDREYELALTDAKAKVTDARIEYGFLMKESGTEKLDNTQALEIQNQIDILEEDYKANKIDDKKYNEQRDELDMKLLFSGAKREEVVLNKSGLTTAINAYKRAKLNYEYTKITAPFKGVVGDFDLVIGQRINSGQKLCKLFNNSTLRIDVGVLESDVTEISAGSSAQIEIPSLDGQNFIGKVVNVSPYIDKETKTCKVSVQIQKASHNLKPGMFVKVNIETTNLQNRVLIPKGALLVRDKRPLVFVVEDGLAKWKYIEMGEQNDEFIEVLSGVEPGENVIVEGQYTLAHDAKVKILK
ncbi:MAG: efflux RND transporter periplasmic adaptor subunit [Bacteroidota bacterium]